MRKPLPEPWRVKAIERVELLSREEREKVLVEGGFSMFTIPSAAVYIDLFTDSGTSAMSDRQWGGLMQGDESYAGSRNFYHLKETVEDVFGMPYFLPVHQGRAAENLLFTWLLRKPDLLIPSNTHFDTTRANIEVNGGTPVDLVIAESRDPRSEHPFKGNIDLGRLRKLFEETPRERIPICMLTLTNNAGGGQPVALANVKATSELCREFGIPLYLDACRFAENAWFIKQREEGQAHRPVTEIVHEIFGYADGFTMSAKKDGLVNMGGLLCSRDKALIDVLTQRLIVIEGFPNYGGLAGRDLEAMAIGLREVLDESYLNFRTGQVRYFGELLEERGVPFLKPTGGHAMYLDAGALLTHIPPHQFPGHSLAVELYREGGVRGAELGTAMFGDLDLETLQVTSLAPIEMVRLAIPRRVYTNSHIEYVADILGDIAQRKEQLKGYRFTYSPPILRHFTARFEEIL
jgi:tyrosine phenol-lyase